MTLRWGVVTDVGRVRTLNEDAVLSHPPLFVVADGMGGHAAGEVASQATVDTLRVLDTTTVGGEALRTAIRSANRVVYERSINEPGLRGMGTTVCAIAENGPLLTIANVGDSRVYRVSAGHFEQVSRDHSYVNELVDAGEITLDEARVHPHRNIVTRALGIEPDVEVDVWEVEAVGGDRYLLCSDGLVDEITDGTIARVLGTVADPQAAAAELVRLANEAGGHDNISVVVVDVIAPNPATAPNTTPTDAPTAIGGTPIVAPQSLKQTTAQRRVKRGMAMRNTLFIGLLAVIVAVVVGGIQYYGQRGTYVGFTDSGNVAVFSGRRDGVLWVKPSLTRSFKLRRTDLTAAWQTKVDNSITFTDRAAAEQWFAALSQNPKAVPSVAVTTTTTTTTTTTIAATTTAPATTTTLPGP